MKKRLFPNFEGISRVVKQLLVLALMIGLSCQLFIAVRETAQIARAKVWTNRMYPSLIRGADNAGGAAYMHFIDTVLTNVPEGSTLYVFSTGSDAKYSSKSFLQYFLLPSLVKFCPSNQTVVACIEKKGGTDAYFWIDNKNTDLSSTSYPVEYTSIEVENNRLLLIPDPD